MWRERIEAIHPGAEFAAPISRETIDAAEVALGNGLPQALVDLLLECNGVISDDGRRVIWSIETIVAENREFRTFEDFKTLYMPFDPLLFFGDDGNGDQYAFVCIPPNPNDQVFKWDHETDSRIDVAWGLDRYLLRAFDLAGER